MKKILKWVGIGFLIFVAVIMVYAFLGKEETLSLQINPIDLSDIADGEYTGAYNSFRWSNTVTVVVEDHQIADIQVVKGQNGREEIWQELIGQILLEQTVALDAVSGATADKKAVLKAVENALQNAQ